jgi:hypothetical protein
VIISTAKAVELIASFKAGQSGKSDDVMSFTYIFILTCRKKTTHPYILNPEFVIEGSQSGGVNSIKIPICDTWPKSIKFLFYQRLSQDTAVMLAHTQAF